MGAGTICGQALASRMRYAKVRWMLIGVAAPSFVTPRRGDPRLSLPILTACRESVILGRFACLWFHRHVFLLFFQTDRGARPRIEANTVNSVAEPKRFKR